MELHQGHHALHPRRGGPVREALLVSRPHSDEKSPRCHERIKIFKKSLWGGNPFRNCSDIAGMLLKSTGEFLEVGLQKSGNEFWESADDSTASDEIR